MPITWWLVGSQGGGKVILGRAIGFHVAEAACCSVLAKSTENSEKRMLAMQRGQRAMLELQRFERIAALERRIFEQAFAAFDQVEQQLGGPVQMQALPAAVQTGESVPESLKKGGSKAITAEFQTLDASQSGKTEGSNNGHRRGVKVSPSEGSCQAKAPVRRCKVRTSHPSPGALLWRVSHA